MALEKDAPAPTSPRVAPNEEWALMYRGGLPGRRIAELAGVSVSTVSYHLRLARAADPELRPARRGQLDAAKTTALDDAVPDWQIGRKRGRRPAPS